MIRNIPETERPREKLIRHGVSSLTNSELIANVICSGTRAKSAVELAQNLLMKYGSLRELSDCLPEELTESRGIGITKACQILSAFELGRRAVYPQEIRGRKLSAPAQVAEFFRGVIGHEMVEKFAIVMLNVKKEVVAWEIISVGILNSSLVHPREVFKNAIRRSTQSVIAVHNHPSGSVQPSAEDDRITRRLAETGALVGIPLVDHVIVSRHGYYSYKEQGNILTN